MWLNARSPRARSRVCGYHPILRGSARVPPQMKAVQIVELSGPRDALRVVDVAEPAASHPSTPGRGVLVEVHAAGVSFPEVLQTRGQYQVKPDLPFTPGSEVAGVVRSAPAEAGVAAGDRVAAFCLLGGWAQVAVAPEFFCFKLPGAL